MGPAVQAEAAGAGGVPSVSAAAEPPEDGRSCGDASSDQYSMQEYDSASQSDASAAEPRSPSHGADAECGYMDPLPTVREDEALHVDSFNHGGALGRGASDGTDFYTEEEEERAIRLQARPRPNQRAQERAL